MTRWGRRLGVRSRLLLAVVGALAVALLAGVTAFNVILGQRLSANATSLARAQAEAEVSALRVQNGTLLRPEGPDEGLLGAHVWIFAGKRVVEAPVAAPELHRAAAALAAGPTQTKRIGETTRLYAAPVVRNGTRYGTVISAVALEPYEDTGRTALVGSLLLAGLLLGASTILTRWILGRALLPVSRMTADAGNWGEHDVDRRFDLGEPYDELTRLAATLDGLLERLSASLRHEQRFAAELSHELRTPLARISAEAELALARSRSPDDYRASLEAIARSAQHMTRTVDALVAAARHEAGLTRATTDVRDAVQTAVDSLRDGAGGSDVDLRVSVPREPVRVAVDTELLERIVQPLLDNALRYGNGVVEVELRRNGASAIVTVADDGPGVVPGEEERIFEPGVRGAAARHGPRGGGLGLALAQRLARTAGGEITTRAGDGGGRFMLRLPLS
jgi:signal transduction histidine kinase